MTHGFQAESLIRWLREESGAVAAVIAPSGAGAALIELLDQELESAEIELADRSLDPLQIGTRAEQLGARGGIPVLFVALDRAEGWDQAELRIFLRDLNFQRERLASGNVRTCLVMSEAIEPAFASLAKDLWDWTIFFRLSDSVVASAEHQGPSPSSSLGSDLGDVTSPVSPEHLNRLRQRWQDARGSGLPERTIVDTYALPYFSAAIELDPEEASDALKTFQHLQLPGFRPETNLRYAKDLMALAGRTTDIRRKQLVEQALDTATEVLRTELGPEHQAKALSIASELSLMAGRYREALDHVESCLELLDQGEPEQSLEAMSGELWRRQQDLTVLLRMMESTNSDPSSRVQSLLPTQEPRDGKDEVHQEVAPYPGELEPPDLGRILERVVSSIDGPTEVISPLLAAWVLSSTSRLTGPTFEQVMRRDPAAYCRGIASLRLCRNFSIWKDHLIGPLADAWASDDETVAFFRPELERWISQATDFENSWQSTLESLALQVFGERYDPTLIPLFCRHLAELSIGSEESESAPKRRRFDALRRLGFLLRWSYQEAAISPLLEVAQNPESTEAEVAAAKSLASKMLIVNLPAELHTEFTVSPGWRRGQETAVKLRNGDRGLFDDLDSKDFPFDVGMGSLIAPLAGDPKVPDLVPRDIDALVVGLEALIRSGEVRADSGGPTTENWIFDSWIPWVARCSTERWWQLTTDLIRRQAQRNEPPLVLHLNPVLGLWAEQADFRPVMVQLLERLTGDTDDGRRLRKSHGFYDLLRWMVVAENDLLIQCLDALLPFQDGDTNDLAYLPIPTVLGWAMKRPVFDYARDRRRAAANDDERHHWFMVEQAFVPRLPAAEALAWCKENWSFAYRVGNLRSILIGHLVAIDSADVLNFLMDDPLVGDRQSFQDVILEHVFGRGDSARIRSEFPEFENILSFLNRGRYFSEIEESAGLRSWGEQLENRIFSDPPDLSFLESGALLPLNALCDWARLEPERFLALAAEVEGWEVKRGTADWGPFRESLLLVWQVVAPSASFPARESLEGRFGHHRWTVRQGLPLYVDWLWNPRFSEPERHRSLRIHYLSHCINDVEIAWHGLAARRHGSYKELERVGRYLLASARQLDRQLAVSLLAWHPQADEILQQSLTEDPSLRVREHAQWAIDVCRRDRMGLHAYKKALQAEDWLHQQAQLEILRPLLLPTFAFWHDEFPELDDSVEAVPPKRRALWYDFRYRFTSKKMWGQILFRDLERYCRGEDVHDHVVGRRSGPPWMGMRELARKSSE